MDLNETLAQYGFTQEQLTLLKSRARGRENDYWVAARDFVDLIPIMPLPLSDKQDAWLKRIQKELGG